MPPRSLTSRRALLPALLVALLLTGPLLARPAEGSTIALPPAAPQRPAAAAVPANAPRLLVRFAPAAGAAERDRAVAAVGGTIDRVLDALGTTRIAITATESDLFGDTAAAVAILRRDPAIARVEADQVVRTAFTPNDSLFLTDPAGGPGQWGLRRSKVDLAWDIARGSAAITVAVVDSGVDATHPDLAGVVLPGATFVSSPLAECTPGSTTDDNGHGTHVAGIVAANGNNGQGIAGVAFGVRILPVKSLDCGGTGLLSDVASGITWAVDRGARVINISLGTDNDSPTLYDAIRYAATRNVLVVAAAGNCGDPARTYPNASCGSLNAVQYPAAYPEVLAVGATDGTDAHAAFSNTAAYVGLSAPGVAIWSTLPTYSTTISRARGVTTYAQLSGTSQAAPLVAGIAALLLGREPGLGATALAARLRLTADDLGAVGRDPIFGAGRVNALRAILVTDRSYAATYAPAAGAATAFTFDPIALNVTVTNTGTRTWSAAGAAPVHLSYHWITAGGTMAVWDGTRAALPADLAPGQSTVLALPVSAPAVAGPYVLRLDLVEEGVTWFSGEGVAGRDLPIAVSSGLAATLTPGGALPVLLPGGRTAIPLTLRNDGRLPWAAAGTNPVRVAVHLLNDRGAMIRWDGERTLLPADVAPGQTVTLTAIVAAPLRPGAYVARIDIVREGIAWFSADGVRTADLPLTVAADFRATLGAGPLTVSRAAPTAQVTVTNTGAATWTPGGAAPLALAAHWLAADGTVLVWDGPRTTLTQALAPGAQLVLGVALGTPPPGADRVVIDVVADGLSWFAAGSPRAVTLVP